MDQTTPETFDIESATDSIGADLFNEGEPLEKPQVQAEPDDLELPVGEPEGEVPVEEKPEGEAPPEVEVKPPPKTWPKEMHEHWSKTPPEVQKYWETREEQMLKGLEQYKEFSDIGQSISKTMAPYMPMIRASGANPAQAVEVLLNANYRLTQGPVESRRQAFMELGQSLGLIQPKQDENIPPVVRQLQQEQERLKATLLQRERAEYEAHRTRVASEVEAFSKDKPYFNDVADDIVAFINQGLPLEQAYEKAVWANPITRAKETARLQDEAKQKLVEKGKVEAAKARKAVAANVTSRDTDRAPTELMGTMDDTMKKTLATIKARTH